METKVGLVGLGLMGSAISRHVQRAGISVQGFDVDEQRRAELAERGGIALGSPAEAADGVGVVFVSVPDGPVVEAVCLGDNGIWRAEGRPLRVVDMSTSMPHEAVAVAERLADHGIIYMDATISGSSDMFEAGDGIAMVGGEVADYDEIADLLDLMVRGRHHVGPVGAGLTTKLVVNLIMNVNRAVLGEGFVLAERSGLDLHALLDVLKDSAAYSRAMDAWGTRILEGDHFPPGSRVAMMHKTNRLIMEQARRVDAPTWFASTLDELAQVAEFTGLADADSGATVEVYRRIAGIGRIPMDREPPS